MDMQISKSQFDIMGIPVGVTLVQREKRIQSIFRKSVARIGLETDEWILLELSGIILSI